jgi:hypothetical protein
MTTLARAAEAAMAQPGRAASSPPRGDSQNVYRWTGPSHFVQYYESEHYLTTSVVEFLATGLATGQPIIVVATAPHREAFARRLRARGFWIDADGANAPVTWLDARATLDRFLVDGMPDRERFQAAVATELAAAARRAPPGTVVRLYGEMVDLLWTDGCYDAAVRLEECWNELASTHAFSLMCAYAMAHFNHSAHAERFEDICRQHGHVVPTERFAHVDDSARLLEISLLQQRAAALDGEIAMRKELERQLRVERAARRRAQVALRWSEQELKDMLAERERMLQDQQGRRDAAGGRATPAGAPDPVAAD